MRRHVGSAGLVLLVLATVAAARPADRARCGPREALTGFEEAGVCAVPASRPPVRMSLDDLVGTAYVMGTTWWDYQQNGTCGKQIAVDREGWVHAVWTNGLNSTSSPRHVYYNVWSPEDSGFVLPSESNPLGVQVDVAQRAGFCGVDVNRDGFAFPAYHHIVSGSIAHSTVSIDFLPRLGAFTPFQIPHSPSTQEIIWPKVSLDGLGNVHTVHTENGGSGLDFYARGISWISGGMGDSITYPEGFVEWLHSDFITTDVSASWHSDRVAVAWIDAPPGEAWAGSNVYLRVSEDGGLNWGDAINVTDFAPIDTNCVLNGGAPDVCNGDTMRPWIDLSVLMDQNDVAHVAFTTHGWYWWDEEGNVNANPGLVFSNLWHWDEGHREYNIVAEAWYSHTSVALGVNNLMGHRPNLALDTVSGYLYCSFQLFDSVQVSEAGFPQGDAYLTVSTTGGRTWAAATNVTNTDGGVGTPAGQCLSERDINLARFVSGGAVHMQYMLDLDAGSAAVGAAEGTTTLNDMIYQRIPVTLIPTAPLINPCRALRADSTGFPWEICTDFVHEGDVPAPRRSTLYQNYPNPFNAATHLQFDLAQSGWTRLQVFDVTGRLVSEPLSGRTLSAGVHVVSFDASPLPSGIYFYRLGSGLDAQTRKMALVK